MSICLPQPSFEDIYFNESFTKNCAILVDAKHSGLLDFWLKKDDKTKKNSDGVPRRKLQKMAKAKNPKETNNIELDEKRENEE
jgi:hypothetical protein